MCKSSIQRWDCGRHIYRHRVELCLHRAEQTPGDHSNPRSCPDFRQVQLSSKHECRHCKETLDKYSDTPTKLKRIEPEDVPVWSGNSYIILTTLVPEGYDPREFSLRYSPVTGDPPVISASEFLPRSLVKHLMRDKKTSAIAEKYIPGDEITNMEGALHTFVTPIVKTLMFGDYVFKQGHKVSRFSCEDGKQRARRVIMSAAVQMDFENQEVMLAACRLEERKVFAGDLEHDFHIPSAKQKLDKQTRSAYDRKLRELMIAHLVHANFLPSVEQAVERTLPQHAHIASLEDYIRSPGSVPSMLRDYFIALEVSKHAVVSLEMLFNAAVHQVRNEFSALERVATQGYIYTYDPPSIFARTIGANLMNRIVLAALKTVARTSEFTNMRAYAFNDYVDPGAIELLRHALEGQTHVEVMRKADLFKGPRDTYDPSGIKGGKTAWLVVHNNSDAFGQNIESETAGGSLDGALGANSEAAASLLRDRDDLLKHLV